MIVEEAKYEDSSTEEGQTKKPLGPGQLSEPQLSISILTDVNVCNLCVITLLK